jgi:hypothetical protein
MLCDFEKFDDIEIAKGGERGGGFKEFYIKYINILKASFFLTDIIYLFIFVSKLT